jgi:hypothetical protein
MSFLDCSIPLDAYLYCDLNAKLENPTKIVLFSQKRHSSHPTSPNASQYFPERVKN